jgi:ATP-dependent Clp protease ATP-binding subunit ClpA
MERIVDLQMVEVSQRLAEHGLMVRLTDEARTWLAKEGYDSSFGARPLRRALQKFVESPLSVKILQAEFSEGDTVIVDYDPDAQGVVFRRPDSEPASVEITKEVSA